VPLSFPAEIRADCRRKNVALSVLVAPARPQAAAVNSFGAFGPPICIGREIGTGAKVVRWDFSQLNEAFIQYARRYGIRAA
jgi:hypothetical protein